MAGIYLLPGSKTDETNMTESPPVSLDEFLQVYARQDDPITQIDDDYISIERFIMAPQQHSWPIQPNFIQNGGLLFEAQRDSLGSLA